MSDLLDRTIEAHGGAYKDDCAYSSIRVGSAPSANAVWTCVALYKAVASIKDHLAFYRDRADEISWP